MKIALLALLGLVLGALGGAALGIGAGLAWIEIFKTTSLEGDSGMLNRDSAGSGPRACFSGSCSESIRICAITKMWIAF